MKTIKDAVIELSGRWPSEREGDTLAFGHVVKDYWAQYHGELDLSCETEICTRTEFETTAKRMGYISGYLWGKEYPTNGKRPDLMDDVEIDVCLDDHSEGNGGWLGRNISVGSRNLGAKITAFRITDPRYKPVDEVSDDEVISTLGDIAITKDAIHYSLTAASLELAFERVGGVAGRLAADEVNNALRESCKELLSDPGNQLASHWHERGELPPVGAECEIGWNGSESHEWYKGAVAYRSEKYTVIVYDDGREICYRKSELTDIEFRPIKSHREKVIEAAMKANIHTSKQDPRDMMVAVIHKLYDSGMLVLPQDSGDTKD